MPPKPKFAREEIVDVALKIVSEKGIEALTARELGAKLGSSARPIFTAFENMEEVQKEVRTYAMSRFENMKVENASDMPLFKQVGMKMVLFGVKEPKLFRLLFMQEHKNAITFEDIFAFLGSSATKCIDFVKSEYALSDTDAKKLFEHIWLHTYAIGALCATGMCSFSEERISQMLTEEFTAMMTLFKEAHK